MMRFEYPGVTRDQAMRWRLKRIFKVGGGLGEDLNGDDDDDIADATHAAALHHLFHTRAGTALMRRVFPNGAGNAADIEHLARLLAHVFRNSTRPAPRDSHQPWPDAKPEVTAKGFPMNRADELETLVKRAGGFAGLCKRISAGAHRDITERELSLLAKGYAMNRFPELTGEQAFAKAYGDARSSGEARAFWDACETLKQAGFMPTRLDDDDEEDDEETGEDTDALDEINEKAKASRRRDPTLTAEQAFAKAYTDPANRDLAKRERRQNGF
jgi:hypothetical protein